MATLATSMRTHDCGCLRLEDVGKRVKLIGWARLIRDHGGAKFIDLCDREGCTQLVFEPASFSRMELVDEIGREYVIQVEGTVRKRPEGTEDATVKTGDVEVLVDTMKIISPSVTPPFEIIEEKSRFLPAEDIRLRWRVLDLRRRQMVRNLGIRSRITKVIRDFFHEHGFWEIETPYLVRSTPEGARDFVVPVRTLPGHFYSLPQSPQLYKQLLMVGGLDRYFQIARCFRDEDLREDRQPEFTQVDFEMSFMNAREIRALVENLIKILWKEILGIDDVQFKELPLTEAFQKYGTDKPDLRFDMPIVDVTDLAKETSYQIFLKIIEKRGVIKCIRAPSLHVKVFSVKDAQRLIDHAIQVLGAKGLTWIIVEDSNSLRSIPESIADTIPLEIQKQLVERMQAQKGDILFFVADAEHRALVIMGHLRNYLATLLELKKSSQWSFVWIVDPPFFERDEEGNILNKPSHHPFTSPKIPSEDYLLRPKEEIFAEAYDLVINGIEVGGGSIRIHDALLQRKIFELLGYAEDEMEKKFGFLLRALELGAPPHGGMALGLDRLVMVMGGGTNIRDFIAFPKTKKFLSHVDGAPTPLDEERLDELGIVVLAEVDEEEDVEHDW